MTWCPESLNSQRSNLELFFVLDNIIDLRDSGIITKYSETRLLGKQLNIAVSMIPMMVSDKDRGQLCIQVLNNVQHLLRLNRIHDSSLHGLFIEEDIGIIVYNEKKSTPYGTKC
jgi:hypothetical protein